MLAPETGHANLNVKDSAECAVWFPADKVTGGPISPVVVVFVEGVPKMDPGLLVTGVAPKRPPGVAPVPGAPKKPPVGGVVAVDGAPKRPPVVVADAEEEEEEEGGPNNLPDVVVVPAVGVPNKAPTVAVAGAGPAAALPDPKTPVVGLNGTKLLPALVDAVNDGAGVAIIGPSTIALVVTMLGVDVAAPVVVGAMGVGAAVGATRAVVPVD